MSLPKFKSHRSFSLEGEDMILRKIFQDKKKGFYVDIGAYRPYKYSNTAYFYERGWSGINIDASVQCIRELKKVRKRDVNIHCLVSQKVGKLDYYCYKDPAYNTISKKRVLVLDTEKNLKASRVVQIEATTLRKVLKKHLPKEQEIDFMTVDVEGSELNALRSNDWNKFRPHYMVVEDLNSSSIYEALRSDITGYLDACRYNAIGKTPTSIIYQDLKYLASSD